MNNFLAMMVALLAFGVAIERQPFDQPPEIVSVIGLMQERGEWEIFGPSPGLCLIVRGDEPWKYVLLFRDKADEHLARKYNESSVKVTGQRIVSGSEWFLVPCKIEAKR